jgi:hypothetical protein
MQTVRTKGLKSRRLDIPPAVYLLVLVLLASLAVLSWATNRSSDSDAEVVQQPAVILPDAAEYARQIDENVNHPDVVGNRALIEAGYPNLGGRNRTDEYPASPSIVVGDGVVEDVVYPEGVMEATDVQLNRAVALAANPELAPGVARMLLLEQNIMLPGDVGHLDDRALSMEEIVFLEVNTFLPDGGAMADAPPGSDHAGMGVGFTRF